MWGRIILDRIAARMLRIGMMPTQKATATEMRKVAADMREAAKTMRESATKQKKKLGTTAQNENRNDVGERRAGNGQ